jgi:hypothetical protein
MELLSTLNEIGIANYIRDSIDRFNITDKHCKNLTSVKSDLKKKCNIVYFTIISSSNSSLKIMAKTLKHSYFYEFNLNTREISLVGGIRKNVVTN